MIFKNRGRNLIKSLFVLMIIFFSVLAGHSFILSNYILGSDSDENPINRPKMSNGDLRILIDSEPIHIEGNQGWIDLKNAGKCIGTGAENNPYIIRDFKINATGYEFCILIEHSNDYFIIENVEVYHASILIKLSNTTNGKIINCRIHDCQGWGIYLIDWSDKNNISSNYIYNNHGIDSGGIAILDSDDNTVAFNILENNKIGIKVAYLSGNKISKNCFYSNQWGIYISGEVCVCIFSDNYFIKNQYEAISLEPKWYSHLWGSIITGNVIEDGLFITDNISEDNNLIAVNSLNGIYTPIRIDDLRSKDFSWSEAALYSWCSGSGTQENPYRISNIKIDAKKQGSCISIENSRVYWVIENCELINSGASVGGLKLTNTRRGKIINNYIHDNSGDGIRLDDECFFIEILKNTISANFRYGIRVIASDHYTPDKNGTLISQNHIKSNLRHGIFIQWGIHKIQENIISDNMDNGIHIHINKHTGQTSSKTQASARIRIIDNIIKNNDMDGVYLRGSQIHCRGNRFENNKNWEIYLFQLTINCLIFKNVFLANYRSACDDSYVGNQWSYNSVGNIWSNYKGTDADDDGIGDIPYKIVGRAGSYDNHPIWNDGIENEDIAIHIDDSSLLTFNWNFARIHGICTGSGTQNDPYIMILPKIDGNQIKYGILIENTDDYFQIQGNSILNTIEYGVNLINTNNGIIKFNSISTYHDPSEEPNETGIILENCQNNVINVGTVYDNCGSGVHLYNSHNNIIENTEIKENAYSGISLAESHNNTIDNCRIIGRHPNYAIYLRNSQNNTIKRCKFIDNFGTGIYTSRSSNNRITNNMFNGDAIAIRIIKSSYTKVSNNIFKTSHTVSFRLQDRCSNIEIYNNEILSHLLGIQCYNNCMNVTLSENKIESGIELRGANQISIINNTIRNIVENGHGLTVKDSDKIKIHKNSITNCKGLGIKIDHCQDINLTYNDIHDNAENGIKITNQITTSCILLQNKIFSNYKNGILVENGENILIIGNLIQFNHQNGLTIAAEGTSIISNRIFENLENGIELIGDLNSILKNKIYSNRKNGVNISSNNNIIRKNHIQDQYDFGVFASAESNNNLIYENILYHNYGVSIDPHISDYYDAFDNGTNNDWNSTNIGNFWSLEAGYFYDGNNDGINDFPIHFPVDNADYLPIYNASKYEFNKTLISSDSFFPGEQLLIFCYFFEDWGIKNVSILIKKDNSIISMFKLFDDGTHSDETIGDMIYTISLDTTYMEATNYSIDVIYEDFLSINKSERDTASFVIKVPRTLILVHGYSIHSHSDPTQFYKIYNDPDIINTYRERIFCIEYYGIFMGEEITWYSPGISRISYLLYKYIIKNSGEIRGNIDFVCHSMGGLVVRHMIKYFYEDIQTHYTSRKMNFNIEHVCLLATPNHGTGLPYIPFGPFLGFILGLQITDMFYFSPFLLVLNLPDETPYSEDIEWYTYVGWQDKIVPWLSVFLIGAKANRFYPLDDHDTILKNPWVLNDLYSDLDIQNNQLLILGTEDLPQYEGTEILVSSNKLDPSSQEPDTNQISLETHLVLYNNAPIDSTSVKIKINPEYDMHLKPGTKSIYQLNFTLPDGEYQYTITALDIKGNEYQITGKLIIVDDDKTPPSIKYSYYGDHTDGNSGFIRVFASDFSKLSIDPSGDYPVPSSLGTHYFTFLAKDNDTDRPEDSLSTTLKISITIEDDDTIKPEITIDYFGSGTDGDPGYFSWQITDNDSGIGGDGDSGFSMIEIIVNYTSEDVVTTEQYIIPPTELGIWNLPAALGTYTIIIVAVDNDDDRTTIIDSLSTTLTELNTIVDDDIIPPEITINYFGGGNDGEPGYFEWEIYDSNSGIYEIEIEISYESSEGLEDFIISIPGVEYGTWNLSPNLGYYTINIFTRDSDNDRTLFLDSLSTEIARQQEIVDDDINPPELSNLVINPGNFKISISFDAIDESGIANISIIINGESVIPLTEYQTGDTFTFLVENKWLFEKGLSYVEVLVKDGDNDRLNDALTSSLTGTFKNVLWDMYEYVYWQLEELKTYIDNNICHRWKKCLIYKLTQTQERLMKAFNQIVDGNITRGLCNNYIAKVFVRIAEKKTELLSRKNKICNEISDYIISNLHKIRNNIVILMGASTGSELAYEIAYLEVELLNLNDYIEQELPYCVGKYLGRKIWCASKLLEIAIFKLSADEEIDCLLRCVQWKLEWTLHKIDCFLEKGKISEVQASFLNGEILEIITKIELLNN